MSGSQAVAPSASLPIPFGPNGCEVKLNGGKCGETQTLRIIDEFRDLYEQKMHQIDTIAGGDCTQAKIKLQQEWINDLTSQNQALVRAVEELEVEATERVRMLEEKMKENAELTLEVMRKYRDYKFPVNVDENLQKLSLLQNDVNNLLEFIRRARDDGEWSVDGLQFYQVDYEDLFGHSAYKSIQNKPSDNETMGPKKMVKHMTEHLGYKDAIIGELENKVMEGKNVDDVDKKLHEANEKITELKQSMKDMRDALTAEVADKHDVIVALRRDVIHLEEQCIKADQQTHFKDDIIKELRKEIKQLKQNVNEQIEPKKIKNILKATPVNISPKPKQPENKTHTTTTEIIEELQIQVESTSREALKSVNATSCKCINVTKKNHYLDYLSHLKKYSDDEKLLLVNLKDEIMCMLKDLHEKDKHILELNELAMILIGKLHQIYLVLLSVDNLTTECCQEENQKLKDAIIEATRRLNELEVEAEQYLADREKWESERRESLKTIENLKNEKNMKEEEFNRAKRQSMETINALENQRKTIEEQTKRLSADVAKYQDKLKTNETDCLAQRKEIENLKCDKSECDKYIVNMKNENKELKKKIEKLKKKVAKLEQYACCERSTSTSEDSFEDSLNSVNHKSKKIDRTKSRVQTSTAGDTDSTKVSSGSDTDDNNFKKGTTDDNDEDSPVIKLNKGTKTIKEPPPKEDDDDKTDTAEKKKSETSVKEKPATKEAELEVIIDQLSESVHRMMRKQDAIKKPKKETSSDDINSKLKAREAQMEEERLSRNKEIKNLKNTIAELEKALKDAQTQNYNLQKAVDIYLESINMMERSDERSKVELQQQRTTITNLQKALVETKQQLEDLQNSANQELVKNWETVNVLHVKLMEMENLYMVQLYQWEEVCNSMKKLEDDNLDLEVDNINAKQDLEMTEALLKKYQQTSLLTEKCVCNLKLEIRDLKEEKAKSLQTIALLQNELQQCTNDLFQLQDILKTSIKVDEHNKRLLQELECLKKNSYMFQKQFSDAKKEICREKQINKLNVQRIQELQCVICCKAKENKLLNEAMCETKCKFDQTLKMNKQLQNELERTKEINEINATQTNYCHEEINNCLCNLQELKLKMKHETELVNQKVLEYTQLQAVYNNQCCDMELLRREIDSTTLYYKDEIIALKLQIQEMTDKSCLAENKCKTLQDDLKEARAKLVEATEREALLQQYYSEQEGELMAKIHAAQNGEIQLIEMNTTLETRVRDLQQAICQKEKALENTKAALQKLKSDTCQKNCKFQEELCNLQMELTGLMDKYNNLMNENEVLKKELACLCKIKSQLKCLQEQLSQAYCEIKQLNQEKNNLCRKNEDLAGELNGLYEAYRDLTDEYNIKKKSIMVELCDTKQDRESLCSEGRHVVRNVRSWIMEQKTINKRLRNDLKCKNAMICKMRKELQTRPVVTTKTSELSTVSTYKPSTKSGKSIRPASPRPSACTAWDLGSEGTSSGRGSPYSITTSVQMELYEPDQDENYGQPFAWVHKVESMTQELQKSNEYWESKLNDYDSLVSRDD